MELRVEYLGRLDYGRALAIQEARVAAKLEGGEEDTLLLLEHEHVYTLGRGAKDGDLMGADKRLGVPVFRIGRGGGVTYHGPGQLVAYPIVALGAHGRDVHAYVRRLEAVLVAVCGRYGVSARGREGLTGVWVDDRKIASLGVGVRRWVAYHGIALNVTTDLDYFRAIVPCAMPEVRMTSLAEETGRRPAAREVAAAFAEEFRRLFGYAASGTAQREAV